MKICGYGGLSSTDQRQPWFSPPWTPLGVKGGSSSGLKFGASTTAGALGVLRKSAAHAPRPRPGGGGSAALSVVRPASLWPAPAGLFARTGRTGRTGLDSLSPCEPCSSAKIIMGPKGSKKKKGAKASSQKSLKDFSVLPQLKKVDVAAPRSSSRPSRRSGSATLPNSARRAASKRRKMDLSGSRPRPHPRPRRRPHRRPRPRCERRRRES